jgi:hypothetical protein
VAFAEQHTLQIGPESLASVGHNLVVMEFDLELDPIAVTLAAQLILGFVRAGRESIEFQTDLSSELSPFKRLVELLPLIGDSAIDPNRLWFLVRPIDADFDVTHALLAPLQNEPTQGLPSTVVRDSSCFGLRNHGSLRCCSPSRLVSGKSIEPTLAARSHNYRQMRCQKAASWQMARIRARQRSVAREIAVPILPHRKPMPSAAQRVQPECATTLDCPVSFCACSLGWQP